MNFFFLRHTSLNVSQETFYGQTDLDVSKNFEAELEKIKIKLIKENVNPKKLKVYSSPLMRCKKLAKCISNNIVFDNRIMELNLGDWEMKPKKSMSQQIKVIF